MVSRFAIVPRPRTVSMAKSPLRNKLTGAKSINQPVRIAHGGSGRGKINFVRHRRYAFQDEQCSLSEQTSFRRIEPHRAIPLKSRLAPHSPNLRRQNSGMLTGSEARWAYSHEFELPGHEGVLKVLARALRGPGRGWFMGALLPLTTHVFSRGQTSRPTPNWPSTAWLTRSSAGPYGTYLPSVSWRRTHVKSRTRAGPMTAPG
jgi:hypothetical protein